MNATNPTRVHIYLKKSKNSTSSELAAFGNCIANFFEFADKGSGYVGLIESNNEITLFGVNSNDDSDSSQVVLLRHATECPGKGNIVYFTHTCDIVIFK